MKRGKGTTTDNQAASSPGLATTVMWSSSGTAIPANYHYEVRILKNIINNINLL